MTTSTKVLIAPPPPVCSNNLEKIDYANMFSKRIPGVLCRVQIGLCSLLCLTEVVWLIINMDGGYDFPYSEVGSSAAGIWCGLLGLIPASFGLWIWKKPSGCTIVTFMVLSSASACLCILFLTMAVFRANLIELYPRHHFSLLMTMSVLQIILGLLQTVATVASVIMPAKTICLQLVTIKRAMYCTAFTTVDKNGDEVLQLQPIRQGNVTTPSNQITLHSAMEHKMKERLTKAKFRSQPDISRQNSPTKVPHTNALLMLDAKLKS